DLFSCFFFQAEDGIRVRTVTGVQTCALPIFRLGRVPGPRRGACRRADAGPWPDSRIRGGRLKPTARPGAAAVLMAAVLVAIAVALALSSCAPRSQRADPKYDTRIKVPTYAKNGRHPRVVIDQAHRNV